MFNNILFEGRGRSLEGLDLDGWMAMMTLQYIIITMGTAHEFVSISNRSLYGWNICRTGLTGGPDQTVSRW